jgi:hypothetical protein
VAPPFLSFQRLYADDLNFITVLARAKVNTQNLNSNSTTLQSDSDLGVPIVANGVYQLEHYYTYLATTTAGFKQVYSGPAGCAVTGATFDFNPGTRAWAATGAMGSIGGMAGTVGGTNLVVPVIVRGLVENGSTAGTFVPQYAQNTSHASVPQVLEGSWLRLIRVA